MIELAKYRCWTEREGKTDIKRKAFCLANFHDKLIFLIAGNGGGSELKSVQRYSLRQNSWSKVAELNQPRELASACSQGNHVYVFGGRTQNLATFVQRNRSGPVFSYSESRSSSLNSIEKLINPTGASNQPTTWQLIEIPAEIVKPRNDAGFVPLNTHEIVILGGKSEKRNRESLGKIHLFNSQTNEVKGFTNNDFKFVVETN